MQVAHSHAQTTNESPACPPASYLTKICIRGIRVIQFTLVTQLSGTHEFPIFKSAMKHKGIRPANLGAFAGEAHLHEGFMLTASAAWRKAAPQLRAGGMLTEEKVRKAFRQMDSDNSGELDEFELRKVVKTMAPQLTDIDIKLMVACADTDDSGVITESEFIAIMMHNHESDKPYWEKYGKRDMHSSFSGLL